MPPVKRAERKRRAQLEQARKDKEAKRQSFNRLGAKIVEWEDHIAALEHGIAPFQNQKGRERTKEERVMAAQTALSLMRHALAQAIATDDSRVLFISIIDKEVGRIHKMKVDHVRMIRKSLCEEEAIIVAFGDGVRGGAAGNYNHKRVLNAEQQGYIFNYIEQEHAAGATVTNGKLRHEIFCLFDIDIVRSTLQGYLHRMGLTWRPTKARKKTFKAYRADAVGTFLIEYAKAKQDPDCVMVFIDESYIHKGHGVSSSYFDATSEFSKGAGKGTRLIILHAITEDGPLCDLDVDGQPVDNLKWSGDTPHPDGDIPGGLTTAECLWISSSSTGDYHDNMNGVMFNQWVREKLHPAFEKKYPGKKMVPVLDNASYHHVRAIPSMSGLSKKKLIQLCQDHGVTYLDVPLTPQRQYSLDMDGSDEFHYVQDRGEYAQLMIDDEGELWNLVAKSAAKSRPFAPTKGELQIAVVSWLQENKPELLECQIEAFVKSKGGYCFYTPPYAAKSQPVELFWAGGKNYTAEHCFNGRSMKQTVQLLREGWHGNKHLWDDPADGDGYIGEDRMKRRKHEALNCAGMVRTAEGFMDSLFIPIAGFSGTIDNLQVPHGWRATTEEMPIDLILNLDPEERSTDESATMAEMDPGISTV